MLFASVEPLDEASLRKRLPEGVDVKAALAQLQADYAMRGVNLVRINGKWGFRTASDLAWLMTRESTETRRLSRAAVEVLAIIAYHQPVTRAEIEEIRGVVTSKGTLDVLLETGWIKPRGRRKVPGRPLTFGTTEQFLSQFNLEELGDLPGLDTSAFRRRRTIRRCAMTRILWSRVNSIWRWRPRSSRKRSMSLCLRSRSCRLLKMPANPMLTRPMLTCPRPAGRMRPKQRFRRTTFRLMKSSPECRMPSRFEGAMNGRAAR